MKTVLVALCVLYISVTSAYAESHGYRLMLESNGISADEFPNPESCQREDFPKIIAIGMVTGAVILVTASVYMTPLGSVIGLYNSAGVLLGTVTGKTYAVGAGIAGAISGLVWSVPLYCGGRELLLG